MLHHLHFKSSSLPFVTNPISLIMHFTIFIDTFWQHCFVVSDEHSAPSRVYVTGASSHLKIALCPSRRYRMKMITKGALAWDVRSYPINLSHQMITHSQTCHRTDNDLYLHSSYSHHSEHKMVSIHHFNIASYLNFTC